jgi:hypothetical protein
MNHKPASACSSCFASQSSNASAWLRHYQNNLLHRLEPEWGLPCSLPDDLRDKLGVSLSHFQLGETGGGTFLLKQASPTSDEDDLAALELFVKEEAEHARILACMVKRLGGKLVKRHWTHRLFKLARRAGGFHFEIQMMLTAEIIGTAYYEMLNERLNDAPLQHALGLMLRDEAGHVAFHADRMKARWREWLPFERTFWQAQFQALVLAALRAAWLDHGLCLRALGFTWENFDQRARRIAIEFLDALHRESATRANLFAAAPSA